MDDQKREKKERKKKQASVAEARVGRVAPNPSVAASCHPRTQMALLNPESQLPRVNNSFETFQKDKKLISPIPQTKGFYHGVLIISIRVGFPSSLFPFWLLWSETRPTYSASYMYN